MRILHVCSEFFPLLKTGGLADVTGALPKAQISEGADVRLLLPGFPAVFAGIPQADLIATKDTFAGTISLRYGTYHGMGIYIIDAPHLYQRYGSPYHDNYYNAYTDNAIRFGLLGWLACELACGIDYYWQPEIVHAHDWHAGLACAYLAAKGYPAKAVFTFHNLAYQGMFAAHHLAELQLPASFYQMHGLEFYGQISFLKAGIFYANHVTTVSPTYANEACLPEFSHGFEQLLEERRSQQQFCGILNGVDIEIWDPETDPWITKNYSYKSPASKVDNKRHIQQEMNIEVNDNKILFCVVSRLSHQKGLDLLLNTLPLILQAGGQFILLGNGEQWLQDAFFTLSRQNPTQIAAIIDYDEALSHRLIAASDVIMIPSRFEPCGLTQLYGLKYGTLPLAHYTGGLADTVADCSLENLVNDQANGFLFYQANPNELSKAIMRALLLWKIPTMWHKVQQHGMQLDFSWSIAAKSYLALYHNLLQR